MKKKQDDLLNSNYDGIQEYDNDLPRWWQVLFYITIAFAVVYVYAFHIYGSLDSQESLNKEMAALNMSAVNTGPQKINEEALLSVVKDAARLASGKNIFAAKCAPCHGSEGQGIVGPNLTDGYWIHGGALTDIRKIVEVGVPEKGMLSWKPLLSAGEMDDVSAYVFSLKGTHPPNPKAPQGDLVPPS